MQAIFKRRVFSWKPHFKRGFFVLCTLILVGVIIIFVSLLVRYQISPNVLVDLIQGDPSRIKQINGRTNIVLFGIGGQKHESGDLTDTIMVVSIGYLQKEIVLVSLPRDIWIPTLKDRINAAYRLGEAKSPGGGMILAKSVVEEVTELPIQYGVMIDFEGFKKMIDELGGIDVDISETFTDTVYPIAGRENDMCDGDITYACRFETITFTKGTEHMDGERALKYVRSRHAEGDVGNDFSRGTRQQTVIKATQKKLFSKEIVTDISKLKKFVLVTQKSIISDIPPAQALLLGRMLRSDYNTKTIGLVQDEPEKKIIGLLVHPPTWQYGGAWVLTPKHGSFTQIGKYIQCVIEDSKTCADLMN